jgi:hypothetical protein
VAWPDTYRALFLQVRHAGIVDVALHDLRNAHERGADLERYLSAAAKARCTLTEVAGALA